ncbi:hypothetical protein Tco_0065792 [Tanacetum coccineum]
MASLDVLPLSAMELNSYGDFLDTTLALENRRQFGEKRPSLEELGDSHWWNQHEKKLTCRESDAPSSGVPEFRVSDNQQIWMRVYLSLRRIRLK